MNAAIAGVEAKWFDINRLRRYLKGLYVIASINYPKVQKEYRYHIRENYFCRLNQIQFFVKDYLQTKK